MSYTNKEIDEEIAASTRHDTIYEKPQGNIFRSRNPNNRPLKDYWLLTYTKQDED